MGPLWYGADAQKAQKVAQKASTKIWMSEDPGMMLTFDDSLE